MKATTCYFVLLLLFVTNAWAQIIPQGFNYQAVARDANGNAQTNTTIGVRFTIRKTSLSGVIEWQEIQSPVVTNSMGQFNLTIGSGVRQVPSTVLLFSDIAWASDLHYLEVEIQTGMFTFSSIGNQQLMSVPYALAAPDPTPAGVINAFGGVSAPAGYLLCRGQAISRTGIYAKLFASIGTAYGNGDGSTTFNVPDFRGMFLRGNDSLSVNDPDAATRTPINGGNSGANVGSYQTDGVKAHNHSLPVSNGLATLSTGGTNVFVNSAAPTVTGTTGTAESRPKNVSVNYIIKY
jgi:microcystin-dependent protein